MTTPMEPGPEPGHRPPPPTAPIYDVPAGPFDRPKQPTTNGLAIAALVCAVGGFVTTISFPVGAILGHVALRQIRERGQGGEGLAKAGIIVGWIGTGLMVLGCIGFVALIGSLNRAGY